MEEEAGKDLNLEWNGRDLWSQILNNDVYLIRIVDGGGRVIGKSKMEVVRSSAAKSKGIDAVPIAALIGLSLLGMAGIERMLRFYGIFGKKRNYNWG